MDNVHRKQLVGTIIVQQVGQADFAQGASLAKKGKSFICLHSTAKGGIDLKNPSSFDCRVCCDDFQK